MALLLVGIRQRLDQLLNSIIGPVEPEVCEGARLLLAECLLTAAFQPEVLTESLVRRLEIVFCLSAASTRNHYRENVVDRWSDFLVLKRAGVFGGSNQKEPTCGILLFHVVARNLRREFLRESVRAADADRGWHQLRHLGVGCREVYEHVRAQELSCASSWSAVRPIWEPIGAILTAVIAMTEDRSQTKEHLRERASQKMSEVYRHLEETARVINVPVLDPHARVGWTEELAVAASMCFALPLPARNELPREKELFWPILLEEEQPSGTVAVGSPATVMEDAKPTLEEDLQAAIEHLALHSPVEIEYLREDLRLQRDCPGLYVAYIDSWQPGVAGVQRLQREVLATGRDELELEERITEWMAGRPDALRARIERTLIDDINSGIPDRLAFASE